MRSRRTSFYDLFSLPLDGQQTIQRIEIPQLQRDYAQGRPDEHAQRIRAAFLDAIVDAANGGVPLALDFVYGNVAAGALQPLDGQQRLTTLFLVHWYLAARTGRQLPGNPAACLTYETRPGARQFCERLTQHVHHLQSGFPSAWATDQPWYLPAWEHDPTISAMLIMLDAIHGRFGLCDVQACWDRLTHDEHPAIAFHVLPMSEFGAGDELYIRMNSRGKGLTDFEIFKARFARRLFHINARLAEQFSQRIDNEWLDPFWRLPGAKKQLDESLVRYLRFCIEIGDWREGVMPNREADLQGLVDQAFASGEKQEGRIRTLFQQLDTWVKSDPAHVFLKFFVPVHRLEPRGDLAAEAYAPVAYFTRIGTADGNLFAACCRTAEDAQASRDFGFSERLLLHAVLTHRIHETVDVFRRLRIVRNLVLRSFNELRADRMPVLVQAVERIMSEGLASETVGGFTRWTVEEERLKEQFLDKHPHLAPLLRRLEDHPLLQGSLVAFEFDQETFAHRAEAFFLMMEDQPLRLQRLIGALLAQGDPSLRVGKFSVLGPTLDLGRWQDRLGRFSREEMTGSRAALAAVLDSVSARGDLSVDEVLEGLCNDWLQDVEQSRRFSWQWYLGKYERMREGSLGRFASPTGEMGYQIFMLEITTLAGKYRDPFLHEIRLASGFADQIEDCTRSGGHESQPSWMNICGIRVRSASQGYAIRVPDEDLTDHALMQALKEAGVTVGNAAELNDHNAFLQVSQLNVEGIRIDTEDRVQRGAELVRRLVQWRIHSASTSGVPS